MGQFDPQFESEDPKDARMYEIENIVLKTVDTVIMRFDQRLEKLMEKYDKAIKRFEDLADQNGQIIENKKRTIYLIPILSIAGFTIAITTVIILSVKGII